MAQRHVETLRVAQRIHIHNTRDTQRPVDAREEARRNQRRAEACGVTRQHAGRRNGMQRHPEARRHAPRLAETHNGMSKRSDTETQRCGSRRLRINQ
eukprot:7591174-Alexandrium_andersonii.AAC.1